MTWRDLTTEQKQDARDKGIVNGCGPSTWRGTPPWFLFTADCEEHDWNYSIGGWEEDRRWYDAGFYSAMVKDIRRLPWYQKPIAKWIAFKMYLLVKYFGNRHFRYGKPRTDRQILESK